MSVHCVKGITGTQEIILQKNWSIPCLFHVNSKNMDVILCKIFFKEPVIFIPYDAQNKFYDLII